MIARRENDFAFWSGGSLHVAAPSDKPVVQKVIEYIEANYCGPISLRDVAQAVGYSPCHLTHVFREQTGTPITAWIIQRRIAAAQRLLGEADVKVAAAAEAVGFNDLCYFTRQFVRHVGMTPGRFRAIMNGRPSSAAKSGVRLTILKGRNG